MQRYNVQGVELLVPRERAFSYLAELNNLPRWTQAFAAVENNRAVLRTPNGEVEIGITVRLSEARGTVDWLMTFPDGSLATAYSRVIGLDAASCVYIFVLTPPPVPLEQLEGTLDAQSRILAEELGSLKENLERHG